MTIAFVSDSIYPYNKGGKEKRLYELSTRLAKLGHEVHVYTMHWWDSPEKSLVEHGVTLHAISKRHDLYHGDKRSISQGLLFGLACFRLFRTQADIIDVDHMPFFPVYSTWLICLLRRKQLHGTWHEALNRQEWIDYMGPAGNIAYLIEHFSIKLPYRITAASAQTMQHLADIHGRTTRVELVASGINSKLIAKLKPAAIGYDVLYTGRLVKDKNIDKLIEAIAEIRLRRPDVTCAIVGHGVEEPALTELIAARELQKNINVLPPLPKASDVYRAMKAAKVFVLPSVREGFGIVALESLGCNTPVVTTDSPSNAARHLIEQDLNGSVVPLETSALAAAIEHWLVTKHRNFSKQVSLYDWNALAASQSRVYAL